MRHVERQVSDYAALDRDGVEPFVRTQRRESVKADNATYLFTAGQ